MGSASLKEDPARRARARASVVSAKPRAHTVQARARKEPWTRPRREGICEVNRRLSESRWCRCYLPLHKAHSPCACQWRVVLLGSGVKFAVVPERCLPPIFLSADCAICRQWCPECGPVPSSTGRTKRLEQQRGIAHTIWSILVLVPIVRAWWSQQLPYAWQLIFFGNSSSLGLG